MNLNFLTLSILMITGISWGLTFSLAKIATDYMAHPFGIALWQTGIASFILFFLCLNEFKKFLHYNSKIYFLYFQLALIGIVVPSIIFFYSAKHLPAGILAITISLVPLLTYLMALPYGIESFSVKRFLGVLLGISSIIIIALPEQSLPDQTEIKWILILCICPICYAAQSLVISIKFAKTENPLAMAFWMNLLATMILLPIIFFFNVGVAISFHIGNLELSLIGLGSIEAICFSLLMFMITRSGPLFASQTGYIVTLSGILWGIFIFNETHSLWVWLSVLLMLTGLTLVAPKK